MMQLCSIVAVVIRNEQDEFLIIQESKPNCRGQWYLPAGRVEPGETLPEAAIRETREESGYEIRPTHIFSVDYFPSQSDFVWIRFGVTGDIVGGALKSTEDRESMRGGWASDEELRRMGRNGEIRAMDMMTIVDEFKGNGRIPCQ